MPPLRFMCSASGMPKPTIMMHSGIRQFAMECGQVERIRYSLLSQGVGIRQGLTQAIFQAPCAAH